MFDELKRYFSEFNKKSSELQFYTLLKREADLRVMGVLNGEKKKYKDEMEGVDKQWCLMCNPLKYTGEGNDIIKYEKDFATMTASISMQTGRDVNNMSTKEFYSLIEIYKKNAKKNSKSGV